MRQVSATASTASNAHDAVKAAVRPQLWNINRTAFFAASMHFLICTRSPPQKREDYRVTQSEEFCTSDFRKKTWLLFMLLAGAPRTVPPRASAANGSWQRWIGRRRSTRSVRERTEPRPPKQTTRPGRPRTSAEQGKKQFQISAHDPSLYEFF